ncbi:MAG: FAD-dependent oxidoreductase [Acidobacteria bacterium]|nr:MAG: FAD-dependent oxidoreductase [Acidobacteriota bacterium]
MAFRFKRPAGWGFKAGQFVDISLLNPPETDAEGNVRGLSLASSPSEATLMVATRMRDTAFKRVLGVALPGVEVKIEGPFGDFKLHQDSQRPAVMFAGGIGITPFRSIILDVSERRLRHHIVLFYFNRRPEDAPFLDELKQIESRNSNYRFIPIMTQPDRSRRHWSGEIGHLSQAMLERYLKWLSNPVYYIAGPAPMVKGIRGVLNLAGIDDDDIRMEEFAGY